MAGPLPTSQALLSTVVCASWDSHPTSLAACSRLCDAVLWEKHCASLLGLVQPPKQVEEGLASSDAVKCPLVTPFLQSLQNHIPKWLLYAPGRALQPTPARVAGSAMGVPAPAALWGIFAAVTPFPGP